MSNLLLKQTDQKATERNIQFLIGESIEQMIIISNDGV